MFIGIISLKELRRFYMKGTVKWFNNRKGYGFITCKGEDDVFVHHTGINMDGYKSLKEGQQVEFELADGKNDKRQAVNVSVI